MKIAHTFKILFAETTQTPRDFSSNIFFQLNNEGRLILIDNNFKVIPQRNPRTAA